MESKKKCKHKWVFIKEESGWNDWMGLPFEGCWYVFYCEKCTEIAYKTITVYSQV